MDIRTSILLILLVPLSVLCLQIPAPAQTDSQMKAIMLLCGASGEESLDEQEVERFTALLSHPLEINIAGRSRMLSCGLLTQFQAAAIFDYRSDNGDVLSVSELASLDGFGEEVAAALAPFISFRSRSLPGRSSSDTLEIKHDLTLRCAFKQGDWNYGIKYKLILSDLGEVSFSARTTYQDERRLPPSTYSFNSVVYGRRRLGKLIVGDFNARFGQGLSLWSGFSMSGFSSSSSFFKRPSGLSPSWSYSGMGSHRGIAADFLFGRFVFSSFLSLPGLRDWCEDGKPSEISVLPGVNLAWIGRNGQASITGYCHSGPSNLPFSCAEGKLSADCRFSFRGTDYFGEASWDLASRFPAAVAGAVVPLWKELKLSVALRCYPEEFSSDFSGGVGAWTKTSDEYGAALGLERRGVVFSADFARKAGDESKKQCKLLLKIPVQINGRTVLSLRTTERLRPDETLFFRTGARCDVDYSSSGLSAIYGPAEGSAWTGRFRLEGLLCRSLGGLSYFEAGRRTERISGFLRCTVFLIDNWDDRIYSYERDAPGNFTVPAYYGRGFSLSAVLGGKIRLGRRGFDVLKINLRASAVRYDFMKEPKTSSSEVKIQAVLDL